MDATPSSYSSCVHNTPGQPRREHASPVVPTNCELVAPASFPLRDISPTHRASRKSTPRTASGHSTHSYHVSTSFEHSDTPPCHNDTPPCHNDTPITSYNSLPTTSHHTIPITTREATPIKRHDATPITSCYATPIHRVKHSAVQSLHSPSLDCEDSLLNDTIG